MHIVTRRYGVGGSPEPMTVMTTAVNGGFEPADGMFSGSEAITAVVWPGDDRSVSATLTVTWNTAPNVLVQFPLATMQALSVGWYDGMVKLADDSRDLIAFRLQVESGPGSATAAKVYCSYQDLLSELPWIGKLAETLQDQNGFAETRGEARDWINSIILNASACSFYGLRSYQDRWDWNFSSSATSFDSAVKAALDADQLMLTTDTGKQIVKAAVYKSLATILGRAVGMQGNNELLRMSREYQSKADGKILVCIAELDTDDDGTAERTIRLNVTNSGGC